MYLSTVRKLPTKLPTKQIGQITLSYNLRRDVNLMVLSILRPQSLLVEMTPAGVGDQAHFQSSKLKEFYTYCETIFAAGQAVPSQVKYKSNAFRDYINITIRLLVSWESGAVFDKEKEEVYIPAKQCQETHTAQPILFALIWKISQIVGLCI